MVCLPIAEVAMTIISATAKAEISRRIDDARPVVLGDLSAVVRARGGRVTDEQLRAAPDHPVLRVRVTLVVGSALALQAIEGKMPVLVDGMQNSLRDLTVADVLGGQNAAKLRDMLLARVKEATGSAQIQDLLFSEMVVR
jgi:hypothetical protein